LIFSGGPRGCIGKNLALLEMKVMVIKFLRRYAKLIELGLKDGKRDYDFRFVYVVKDSTVQLTKREK
jgi:cytochrome P450